MSILCYLNPYNKTNDYRQITAQLTEVESLKIAVDNLLNQVPSVDLEDAQLVNLWASLTPYISTDIYVRDFSANLWIAINLASELGIVHPNISSFALATWLHNTVRVNISELKTALNYANHTVTAIIEADSAANIYRQNSQSLAEINSTHEQLLLVQQNLQARISEIQKRQSEIHSLTIVLDTWLLTAESNIFNSLKQSLKNRQKFTVELITLPVEIITMMQKSHNTGWQNILNDFQFKFDDLVQKYSQWVKASSLLGEIKNLLVRGQNLLGNRPFSETDVSQISFSKEIDSVVFLLKLKQIAQKTIDSIEKPLNICEKIFEWILTFALNYKSFNSIVKLLRKYSRSYSALISLEAIKRQAKVTLQKVKPVDNESILTEMTSEAIQWISTTARTCLNQLQFQTEETQKQLEEQLSEKVDLAKQYQQQILAAQDDLKDFQNEADFKLKRAIALLQELAQFSHLPDELRLVIPVKVENTFSVLTDITQFKAKISLIENKIKQLENAASLIDNIALLVKIQGLLTDKISHTKSIALKCDSDLREYQQHINEVIVQLQQKLENISIEKSKLKSAWEEIPEKFKLAISVTDLFHKQTIDKITNQTDNWQQKLKNEELYLKRYQHFIQDWIEKLRQPSDSDRNELRRIYLNNANVVGITCVQAANRNFSDEFKYFDVVIIDEVSKCTPPELLIPALKGKKLIMVGDHKQLPPMLDTDSLEEVAQQIGCTREELEFLEESIFKLQFESADDSIKQMLTTQYRMHPFIMGAINQFYENRLECGILEPDIKRAHNLTSKVIKEKNHIIWVKTPINPDYQEQKENTSFYNLGEIKLIKDLCTEFENIWTAKVANGEPKKEIAVITFYGAQLRKIDQVLRSESFPSLQIRLGTVDRFQGMERPVVIVSMVRNNKAKDVGFAKKPERVNVAFSRAQELLIIVGCHELFTLQRGKVGNMYSQVSQVIRHQGGLIDVSRICG